MPSGACFGSGLCSSESVGLTNTFGRGLVLVKGLLCQVTQSLNRHCGAGHNAYMVTYNGVEVSEEKALKASIFLHPRFTASSEVSSSKSVVVSLGSFMTALFNG